VLLPVLGWVGFDPANDVLAGERHLRVALGRDYNDVPPTHGVFKGETASELTVSVRVRQAADPSLQDSPDFADNDTSLVVTSPAPTRNMLLLQQQQQQ
jgi:transglutaminase-like putative cysteine protease